MDKIPSIPMTKVALLNPPITFKDRYGISSAAGGNTPPNGLLMIAGVLREKGFEIELFDGEKLKESPEKLAIRVAKYNPDILGITAVTMSVTRAHETAYKIKKMLPHLPIIVGGPHVSALPVETLKRFKAFDIVVSGEGEKTAVEVFKTIEKNNLNNEKLKEIDGLGFRDGETIILTKPRQLIKDLDSLPFPEWDLLDGLAQNYSPPAHTTFNYPAAMIVSSRGCVGKCTFCDQRVFGNRLRYYSASYVMEMISYLVRVYGVREIHFNDDNFVVSKKRLLSLCDLLSKIRPRLTWTCLARVDHMNLEILKIMAKAGCKQIDFGIESGSQKLLDLSLKGETLKQIKDIVLCCQMVGINAKGNFMIGMPGETRETLDMTEKFLLELPLNDFHATYYTPLPGSESFKTVPLYGSLIGNYSDMTMWKPVFIPHGLTANDLIKASKRMFRRFYFRPKIVLDYLRRIRSFKHLTHYLKGVYGLLEWIFKKKNSVQYAREE